MITVRRRVEAHIPFAGCRARQLARLPHYTPQRGQGLLPTYCLPNKATQGQATIYWARVTGLRALGQVLSHCPVAQVKELSPRSPSSRSRGYKQRIKLPGGGMGTAGSPTPKSIPLILNMGGTQPLSQTARMEKSEAWGGGSVVPCSHSACQILGRSQRAGSRASARTQPLPAAPVRLRGGPALRTGGRARHLPGHCAPKTSATTRTRKSFPRPRPSRPLTPGQGAWPRLRLRLPRAQLAQSHCACARP